MNRKYYFGILSLLAIAGVASALTTSSLVPVSDGNYTSWTPNSGASHFALVDEATCNGTTDYNSTNTVGNRDSYGISLATVPNGSVITDIAITPCASRNSAGGGSSTMNVFYRMNGTNSSDAGGYALTGTTPAGLSASTFSSLNILKTSTSTLESGAVYSAGTRGARLSRIGTVITYTSLTISTSSTYLTASTVSSSQINLAWSDVNTIEDGYFVERGTSVSGPFSQIATTSTNSIAYNDTGLSPNTKYWYRIRAYNFGGQSSYSNIASSTTSLAAPTVSTDTAIASTSSTALLKGNANPNKSTSTGWFRYSTTDPVVCDDTFGTRAPLVGGVSLGNGSTSVAYSNFVTSLSSSTTYYYCALASNAAGTAFGTVQSFTTTP